MGEFIKIILAIILMIFICMIIDYLSNVKRLNINKKSIINNFGKEIDIEDVNYKMESVSTYFRNKNEEECIDDITWSDLSMDNIFKKINNTQSTVGSEVLYYILRTPLKNNDDLIKRDNIIEYFSKNNEERLDLQLLFSRLGYNYDSNTTLSLFMDEDRSKNKLNLYRFLSVLPIISILLSGLNKSFLFITLLSVCLNIFISFNNNKSRVDVSGFSYIIKVVNVAFKIKSKNLSIINENMKDITDDLHQVRNIKKKSVSTNPNAMLSDLNFISEYAKMIFLSELITYEKVKENIIKNKEYLKNIYEFVGTIDALIGVSSFRESLNYYSKPQLFISSKKNENLIDFIDLYHPLVENPVSNSLSTNGGVLITGSNASGKSTFIKSVAINQILGQTIFTTCAKSYKASFFNIYTSMALKDDVLRNESYYIVEIKSLKRIIDKSNDKIPTLCFVDEILRGTNTIERIASSSEVLNYFNNSNCICFAATHDIELTYLLEDEFNNYHFEEEITDKDIVFDYVLKSSRANSRNAIKLLGLMGYDDKIIDSANERAEQFITSGKWK